MSGFRSSAAHRRGPSAAVKRRLSALLASTMIIPASVTAQAQNVENAGVLEEIVVTAQKREQRLQDVAVAVQVLGNQQLEDLNINGFEDYIQYLPAVNFSTNRPGISQVYIRGIVSGNNGNHSASRPSVGVYLDEQPITTINEILDLHAYDIARIETLSGPQGTLFGASSQSGTLRIITNKPVIGEFEAGYDVAANKISHGEFGYTLEGFANLPVGDNAALRLVAWHDTEGGYIDNIPETIVFPLSGIVVDNSDVVEDDFNNTYTTGGRAQLKVDLNDSWTTTAGLTYQDMHSTGAFTHDPEDIGDLNARRMVDDDYDEHWYQASLTIEGHLGGLDLVYAGAYLDRRRDSFYDYTGYSEYLEQYYADYNAYLGYQYYYCLYYTAAGDCADPTQFVTGDEQFKRNSHEFRVQSAQDKRLRFIAGLYYQNQTHDFDLQWTVPDADPAGTVVLGGDTVVWQTKQVRIDRDRAAFGEIYFDINDRLTLTGGARLFKYRNSLYGFNGFLRHCTGFYDANGNFVQDPAGTPQYPCFNTRILDGLSKGDGNTWKLNLSYKIDDDKMIYATYSEGFRAGGVNRARVPGIPNYNPDWVYNYEIGWKTTWLDNRLRFNGSAYWLDWKDFQYAFLDFTVSNLTIISNIGQARTKGFEFDLVYALTDRFTWSLSASYNDAKLRANYYRNSIEEAAGFARAFKGDRMPFAPKLQFTTTGRYEFNVGGLPAYAQAALSHTGKSWSHLERDIRALSGIQKAYTLVNLAAGVNKDNWSFNVFADNITDTRAQLSKNYPGYPSERDTHISTNRPRTIGIRFGQKF